MKIITFYSDSHYNIYNDYFLPSYKNYLSQNKLITKKINQISPTGEYESEGFDNVMVEKINFIIENIDINEKTELVYADCDVQFFKNFSVEMGDNDILFQDDFNAYCAGFFIAKQTQKVLDFFVDVKEKFIKEKNGKIHDQNIINMMFNEGYNKIKKDFLPNDNFWTVAFSTQGQQWYGQDIEVPKNIVMHHANFTVGIQNKINLLNLVKQIYEK